MTRYYGAELVSKRRIELAGRIIAAARAVSTSAPAKRAKYVSKAGVSWSKLEELRDELARWDSE